MKTKGIIAIVLMLCLFLAGCGQTGGSVTNGLRIIDKQGGRLMSRISEREAFERQDSFLSARLAKVGIRKKARMPSA